MSRNAHPWRAPSSLLATIAAILFLAAACGEGEAESAVDAIISDESEQDAGQEPPDAAEPDEEAASQSSNGDSDMFCEAAGAVDESMDTIGIGMSPEELEISLNRSLEQMDMAIDYAPDDIRSAVETSAEAVGLMAGAIEDAGYDMLDVDLATVNKLDSDPKYQQADDELSAYLFDECGIGSDPALDAAVDDLDDGDGTELVDGSVRDQLVAELTTVGFTQEEAACLSQLPDLLEVMTSTDTTGILAAFADCDIPPERLVQLAG